MKSMSATEGFKSLKRYVVIGYDHDDMGTVLYHGFDNPKEIINAVCHFKSVLINNKEEFINQYTKR